MLLIYRILQFSFPAPIGAKRCLGSSAGVIAFGFVLYGPFTVLGPMRNTEFSTTIGLFSAIGGVTILTTLFFLYGQAGGKFYQPPANPTVPNPPKELFNSESWTQFQTFFWLGGSLGAVVAWFIYSNEFIGKLYQVSLGG